jgi:hypothetical protein
MPRRYSENLAFTGLTLAGVDSRRGRRLSTATGRLRSQVRSCGTVTLGRVLRVLRFTVPKTSVNSERNTLRHMSG